jgi:hypothetical protein
LHLPLPADAPRGKIKVTATLESHEEDWPERRACALAALERLAARGGSAAFLIRSRGSGSNAKTVRCQDERDETAGQRYST